MTRSAAASPEPVRPGRAPCGDFIVSRLCVVTAVLTLALLAGGVAAAEASAQPQSAGGASPDVHSAPASSAPVPQAANAGPRQRADFGRERASRDARQIADWIVDSADNKNLPFVVVDKLDARIFVFDASGHIRGAGPALLGLARGDETVPGIGDRSYADMPPATRTTPAGRFVAALGMNTRGEDVVWVDYEAAVDIHRVVTNHPKDRRLERLATPTTKDNRISYGCINVPKRFYEKVVAPAFAGTNGIVYVLPETHSVREFFGAYDVDARPGPDRARSADAQH
jgi:hypothetical protein